MIEEKIYQLFTKERKTLALAESCTGGRMAAKLTSVPGSSDYFLGSLVVYSNELKMHLLQVKAATLQKYGAVSKEVVTEMLQGLFHTTSTNFGIAVSGIAGPTGGSPDKPVGTIWAAVGERGKVLEVWTFRMDGDRNQIIEKTSTYLLETIFNKLKSTSVVK
jgi:PncC family amidohydrolase